jgi:predicted nuclease with RNAse H fold
MGAPMVTLGVDLAAQDANTGICRVRWADREAVVELAQRGASDEQILDEARAAVAAGGAVGVDAPLGWPAAFAAAVAAWAGGGAWPLERSPEPEARSRQSSLLRLRETDRFVVETTRARGRALHPLSVSTDKIGIPAMRAAALLSAAGAPSRVHGPWFEVYPAAARDLWALPPENIKRERTARERRLQAIDAGVATAGAALRFAPGAREACLASDDVLDALLCAFVARAAALGETFPPPDAAHADAAKREGWIHMPCGGLADLFTERQSGRYVRSGG